LNLGYGYSNASTGRLDPTGRAITSTSWTTQLTASYDILDGFRRFNQLDNASKNLAAELATYEEQRYQIQLNVRTSFFNAVAGRERIQVEQDRVDRQLEQLTFVRQQVQLGQATRADSLQSRVDLNNARLALLNAQNDARSAQFALAEAMGVDQRVTPALEAVLDPDTLGWERGQLMQIAQRQAPRIRSARLSVEAAEASVETQKSSYFPSLRFSGGFDWGNTGFPPKNRSWSLRLSGSLPLFDGLQRETGVARALAQTEITQAQLRSTELAVRSAVDDAYSQIETALAGLRLAEESVELSRETLRVNQQRYRFGTATILDLQQAQINLRQAQVDVIQRKFDYQVGVAQLESLLGLSLESLTE
jgi:outer membrane protein TolC